MFNRGKTNPGLFEGQVEKIVGDRETDLGQLAGRKFDACIDPSGYLPGQLEISGRALRNIVDRYVFISWISVYPNFTANMDESGELECRNKKNANFLMPGGQSHDERWKGLANLSSRAKLKRQSGVR